jgi:hypothetical protein
MKPTLRLILIIAVLAGCSSPLSEELQPTKSPTPPTPAPAAATSSPEVLDEATATPTREPLLGIKLDPAKSTATPSFVTVALDAGMPRGDEGPLQSAVEAVRAILGDVPMQTVEPSAGADLRLSARFDDVSKGTQLVYERVLTPVDRFSSYLEGIGLEELRGAWTGNAPSPDFTTLYPSQDVLADLELLLGPAGPAVKPQPAEAVADAVWGDETSIGIVPFEALTPRLRALRLDGMSVVDNRLEQSRWPLATRAWLSPASGRGADLLKQTATHSPITNRDPKKLTVLVMTGVTAMARGTAVAIERAGDYAFPARVIGPELAAADLTDISNEIPFMASCVPDNSLNNLLLCSKPAYFTALEASGVDLVGLTGNHQNDFGYDNDLASLKLYEDKGIPTYGGGKDDKAARKPLIVEHNGNRLAFLGANSYGPQSYPTGTGQAVTAWATDDNPGSARFDRAQMIAEIQALKPQVDLVLAEVQHTEFNENGEYQTTPLPEQVADFQALKDGGADIVTGVMAHAPQAVELRGDGIILYGLGNLYFDQTWSWPTRTGLVVRHAIYDGRLLNTELLVTVIEPDMQLRWATPQEKLEVLKSVFAASGW